MDSFKYNVIGLKDTTVVCKINNIATAEIPKIQFDDIASVGDTYELVNDVYHKIME